MSAPLLVIVALEIVDWRFFYWNVRAALNLQIGDVVVGLGYEASNLDYYSSRRNVILQNGSKFQVPERMLHQNIFLMLGYRF